MFRIEQLISDFFMDLNLLYYNFYENPYDHWGMESSCKSQGPTSASVTKKAKTRQNSLLSLTYYSESSSNACVNRKSS